MQIYERIREEFRNLKTRVGDLLSLVSYLLLLYTTKWSPDVQIPAGTTPNPAPGTCLYYVAGEGGCKWFFHNKPIAKNLL